MGPNTHIGLIKATGGLWLIPLAVRAAQRSRARKYGNLSPRQIRLYKKVDKYAGLIEKTLNKL